MAPRARGSYLLVMEAGFFQLTPKTMPRRMVPLTAQGA